jgi:hypothetical protein
MDATFYTFFYMFEVTELRCYWLCSRKHFGEKEAQHWWEENRSRVMENAELDNPSITS